MVRAIRAYAAHIERHPVAQLLRRARDLDLGRRKVGRPCVTFNTSLTADLARTNAPEGGWGPLLLNKAQLTKHLKKAPQDCESSEGEGGDDEDEEEDNRELEADSSDEE